MNSRCQVIDRLPNSDRLSLSPCSSKSTWASLPALAYACLLPSLAQGSAPVVQARRQYLPCKCSFRRISIKCHCPEICSCCKFLIRRRFSAVNATSLVGCIASALGVFAGRERHQWHNQFCRAVTAKDKFYLSPEESCL